MQIYIYNASKRMSSDLNKWPGMLQIMGQACDIQIRDHVGPAWGCYGEIFALKEGEPAPLAGKIGIIGIFDAADQPDALGDHTENSDDTITGGVYLDPIFENGGDYYSNPTLSVSQTLSHEIMEMKGNPFVNSYWQMPNEKNALTPQELSDAVEADSYQITILGEPVQVSNFIYPAWGDPYKDDGQPTDYLDHLNGEPLKMSAGGYLNLMSPSGDWTQIFGKEMPEWKREQKKQKLANKIGRLYRNI